MTRLPYFSTISWLLLVHSIAVGVQAFQSPSKSGSGGVSRSILSARTLPLRPALFASKKPLDRAHKELELEQAMGDDWRLFRAKLVAQEQQSELSAKSSPEQRRRQLPRALYHARKFGQRCLSICNQSRWKPLLPSSSRGVSPSSKEHYDRLRSMASMYDTGKDATKDPFASVEELVIFQNEQQHNSQARHKLVDRHFWAHPMSHIEVGSILLASDSVRPSDPNYQAAILILEHGDGGTVGIALHKPTRQTLRQVDVPLKMNDRTMEEWQRVMLKKHLTDQQILSEEFPFGNPPTPQDACLQKANHLPPNLNRATQMHFWYAPVYDGGPVARQYWETIHGWGHVDGSTQLVPGVFLGGASAFCEEGMAPDCVFLQGRTVWTKRQMNRELRRKQWIVASVSSDFLLAGTKGVRVVHSPPSNAIKTSAASKNKKNNNLWASVLTSMGGKYAQIVQKHRRRKGRTTTMEEDTDDLIDLYIESKFGFNPKLKP